MLQEFLSTNRETLIARCRSKVARRRALLPATEEDLNVALWPGIPLFLDQLINALRLEQVSPVIQQTSIASGIGRTAAKHGNELLRRGFTVGQVVQDYGDLCQAITELASELKATVSAAEFGTLNLCLDDAIADAVTEFGRQRDEFTSDESTRSMNERLGVFAHELRNLIHTAILAVATIRTNTVGLGGATGDLLDRSLIGLRELVDRTIVEVRLTAGISERRERIVVADFIAEVQVVATIEAAVRDLEFIVAPTEEGLAVEGDRQLLAAAVANLLQNAVKFTRPHTRVSLHAHAVTDRILIDVEDECGGLPEGKEEEIFRPFEQLGTERTGLGLGLAISRRGIEANGGKLRVRNLPGAGCVFTVDLPCAAPVTLVRDRENSQARGDTGVQLAPKKA
jgi:signal transduction histidine kinase